MSIYTPSSSFLIRIKREREERKKKRDSKERDNIRFPNISSGWNHIKKVVDFILIHHSNMNTALITDNLVVIFIFHSILWFKSFIFYHVTVMHKHGSILIRVLFMSIIMTLGYVIGLFFYALPLAAIA